MVGPVSSRALVALGLLTLAACGGTSVEHRPDGSGAASGAGGMNQGARGGTAGTEAGGAGTTGGGPIAGGSSATTGGTASATGGTASATNCLDVNDEYLAELKKIQSCAAASDCGQVLTGTSCGCTHALVARLDADTSRFYDLLHTSIDGVACVTFGGTCDCPPADGFACDEGRCTWNYVREPWPDPDMCEPAGMGVLCVVGEPVDSGEALREGMPLELEIHPFGCFSSSCTVKTRAACDAEPVGNDFTASSDICLGGPADPNTGCTGDCADLFAAHCLTTNTLTAGTHTVRSADNPELSVTFTVPSVVTDGSLCSGKPF